MYQEDMMHRTRNDGGCGCGEVTVTESPCAGKTWGIHGYPLAIVFAPIQKFDHICDLDTAMRQGTIFEELHLPFSCGDHGKGGGCCGR